MRNPPFRPRLTSFWPTAIASCCIGARFLPAGITGKAEEIVQELCLYFTLTQPDLTSVANLDGYLYTSLRHIYLSGLARSSREAQHFVSVAEFDSFESALTGSSAGDPLQRQNDLRRICGYAVWRKESSKSASYFILHFFHGYGRREIAELACLPISAIYNKLKIARSEVVSYLEAPGKLRVVNRDLPPQPRCRGACCRRPSFSASCGRPSCRPGFPIALIRSSYWRTIAPPPKPVSCSLLAHIVSCERCLSLVDRHFRRPTLQDREPLDCLGSSSEGSNGGADQKTRKREACRRFGSAGAKFVSIVQEHCPLLSTDRSLPFTMCERNTANSRPGSSPQRMQNSWKYSASRTSALPFFPWASFHQGAPTSAPSGLNSAMIAGSN